MQSEQDLGLIKTTVPMTLQRSSVGAIAGAAVHRASHHRGTREEEATAVIGIGARTNLMRGTKIEENEWIWLA